MKTETMLLLALLVAVGYFMWANNGAIRRALGMAPKEGMYSWSYINGKEGYEGANVVDVVVQIRSVQFLQKSFETEWVLHQAKFKAEPKPKKAVVDFSDCLFEEEPEEEEDEDFF